MLLNKGARVPLLCHLSQESRTLALIQNDKEEVDEDASVKNKNDCDGVGQHRVDNSIAASMEAKDGRDDINKRATESDKPSEPSDDGATESDKTSQPSDDDLKLLMAKMVHEVNVGTVSRKEFLTLLSIKLGDIDLTSRKWFIRKTLSSIINSGDNEEGDIQPTTRKKNNDDEALAVSISSVYEDEVCEGADMKDKQDADEEHE
jgi:hypothetical protein